MANYEVLTKDSFRQALSTFQAAVQNANNAKSAVDTAIHNLRDQDADLADAINDAYASTDQAVQNLQTQDQQVQDAINQAIINSDVDLNYVSYSTGQLPNSAGASAGTIGIFFTENGYLQKIKWDGSAWQEIGAGIPTLGGLTYTDVRWHGAKGDGVTDDTDAIQAAIDSMPPSGGLVVIPNGEFRVDTLRLSDNITLKGRGMKSSVFKPIEGASTEAIIGGPADIQNVSITDLGFLIDKDIVKKAIRLFSSDGELTNNLYIYRCHFETNKRHNYMVILGPKMDDITIKDNTFVGYDSAEADDNIASIFLAGLLSDKYTDRKIEVIGNKFKGGYIHVRATSGAPAQLIIKNNVFSGFSFRCIYMHAPVGFLIEGNTIQDGTAQPTDSNDGAAIWLDRTSVGETAGGNSLIVKNNTIRDVVGNGMYLEELENAKIINNDIIGCSARVDNTFTVSRTFNSTTANYSSDGGYGILVTGGCINTKISGNNIIGCESGVYVSRALGVHPERKITNINIKDNLVTQNKKDGIVLYGKLGVVRVDGNDIIDNGMYAPEIYSGLLVTRKEPANFLTGLLLYNNNFDRNVSTSNSNQYHSVYCDYNGNGFINLRAKRNLFKSDGSGYHLKFTGIASARITDNAFLNLASVDVTTDLVEDKYIARNQNYTTKNAGNAFIPSGETEVTVNHGLDETPRLWDIRVIPGEGLNSNNWYYVDQSSINDTQFKIKVDNAPLYAITFGWVADVE